ncbi:MAG: hypothetical protein ACI4IE_02275 [Eubacterium sp.]
MCVFVACSVNGSSETASTTAVTNSYGITHYNEPVTEENIVTVTNKYGDTVAEVTTAKSKTTNTQASSASAKSKGDNVADINSVTVSEASTATTNLPTKTTTASTQANTAKEQTQPVTDKDGWVNKWY